MPVLAIDAAQVASGEEDVGDAAGARDRRLLAAVEGHRGDGGVRPGAAPAEPAGQALGAAAARAGLTARQAGIVKNVHYSHKVYPPEAGHQACLPERCEGVEQPLQILTQSRSAAEV